MELIARFELATSSLPRSKNPYFKWIYYYINIIKSTSCRAQRRPLYNAAVAFLFAGTLCVQFVDKYLSRGQLTDSTAATEIAAEEHIRFGIHEVRDVSFFDLLDRLFGPVHRLLQLRLLKHLACNLASLEEVELEGCRVLPVFVFDELAVQVQLTPHIVP